MAFGQNTVDARGPTGEAAEKHSDIVKLPEFVLEESRVANDLPASTFPAPVSSLRFEPRVDLQTRNFGEAQGDISIRGGIFEGTAIQLSGLTIFDPQTGHYAAELPVPPEMLGAPQILTGADHAFSGMGATAGTVQYAWRDIRDGGSIQAAVGNGSLHRESIHAGRVLSDSRTQGGTRVASEAEVSYSAADGTIANGDHQFFRAAGRVQLDSAAGQTNLFAGYQSKFFGWPNLYTPFGVAETEDIHTTLLVASHRRETEGVIFETAAHYRRNKDDYEFNRFIPGQFNPFQHETQAGGAFVRLNALVGDWRIDARVEAAMDEIESTSLGSHGRTYWKLGAIASRHWGTDRETAGTAGWTTRFGVTYDDTNREGSAISPIAELAWEPSSVGRSASTRWYLQFSESSRVPGYTALYSPPNSGLFRGNPNLGREDASNVEAGVQVRGGSWSLHAAVFRRRDDLLVDWTYSNTTPNARSASAVRVDNTGFELVVAHSWHAIDLVGGYTWLDKNADYFALPVDASFYALNFAKHRLTLAIIARLGGGFEIRADNEYRVQEPNPRRTVGGAHAFLSALGVYWRSPTIEGFELSLIADNLWQSKFQELPAVPAPGRQVTLSAGWRW